MQQKIFFTLFFLGLCTFSYSQDQQCEPSKSRAIFHGSNILTYLQPSGGLFRNQLDEGFIIPFQPGAYTSSIRANGLFMAGKDPSGNIKAAMKTYGYLGWSDYVPGPLDQNGNTDPETCNNWDKIWMVKQYEVLQHIVDFLDNGQIDNPSEAIFSWPGIANPHFLEYNGFELPLVIEGLAPFYDANGNGFYDPDNGDYPLPENVNSQSIPELIAYGMINDAGKFHTESYLTEALNMQVQFTCWTFGCLEESHLNNAFFTKYKFTNKGTTEIDSLKVGIFTDFDLGCYIDNCLGTFVDGNSVYAYNCIPEDGGIFPFTCLTGYSDFQSYEGTPPVQALTFLNQELDYSLIDFNPRPSNGFSPEINRTTEGIWENLQGKFYQGVIATPITPEGTGYNPESNSEPITYMYPGNPNDSLGWTMISEGLEGLDIILASTELGNLDVNETVDLDIVYSFFKDDNFNHLSLVELMYQGVGDIQFMYDNQFNFGCEFVDICTADCVWPGDLNADGVVNHFDVFGVGVANLAQGSTRPSPLNWAPRNSEDWSFYFPAGGNFKHIDANGDGLINIEDGKMIQYHFGQRKPNYNSPVDIINEGPEVYIEIVGTTTVDTVAVGQPIFARIKITDVPDLYGVAFTLEYDTSMYKYFEFRGQHDYFIDQDDKVTYLDEEFGRVNFSTVKILNNEVLASGVIALAELRIDPEILDQIMHDNQTVIRFKNVKGIDAAGNYLDIGATDKTLTIREVLTSSGELTTQKVKVYPNPNNGNLKIESETALIDKLTLIDVTGKNVFYKTFNSKKYISLDLPQLPSGIYFLQLETGNGIIMDKLVIE